MAREQIKMGDLVEQRGERRELKWSEFHAGFAIH